MLHVLSNKYIVILFTLLALASCGGREGELRIKGEIKGLNADLTMYSRDGVIQGIDTLHVIKGKIDWTCPYNKEGGSLTIVYPTYSTLTVFCNSGDVIVIEGDAKQLGATKVSGNADNDAYTLLRQKLSSLEDSKKDSLIEEFVNTHPESSVTRMLQLEKLATRQPLALSIGEMLPEFSVVTRKGDTINNDSLRGKFSLLVFWANWRGGTGTMNTRIRRLRRQAQRPLVCLSYNLDVNSSALDYIERTDSITWHSYNNKNLFMAELPSRLGVRDIPYYVLTDTTNRIIASGSDWKNDMEPVLNDSVVGVEKK
jgi:hypothetical protein